MTIFDRIFGDGPLFPQAGRIPMPTEHGYPTADDLKAILIGQQNMPTPIPAGVGVWSAAQAMTQQSQQAPRHSLLDMLCMRLFNEHGSRHDFQDLHCVKLAGRVIVFAAIKDDYVVVEDDASLFPSDKLICSLRLLL